MITLLTLYTLAGMTFLIWAFAGAPEEDMAEIWSVEGFAACLVFALLWPLFMIFALLDLWSDK